MKKTTKLVFGLAITGASLALVNYLKNKHVTDIGLNYICLKQKVTDEGLMNVGICYSFENEVYFNISPKDVVLMVENHIVEAKNISFEQDELIIEFEPFKAGCEFELQSNYHWLDITSHDIDAIIYDKPNFYKACLGELNGLIYELENTEVKRPMIVYLHEDSAKGDDLRRPLYTNPIPLKLVSEAFQEDNPCYVFVPQIGLKDTWEQAANELFDTIGSLIEFENIDATHVYLVCNNQLGQELNITHSFSGGITKEVVDLENWLCVDSIGLDEIDWLKEKMKQ